MSSNTTTTVLGALMSGDARAALDGLLAVWRRTRAPAVGDLIDQVSQRVMFHADEAFANTAADAADDVWTTIANRGDSRDVGALLARWRVDVASETVSERLTLLIEIVGDDPRLSAALATMLLVHARGGNANGAAVDNLNQRAIEYLRVFPDVRTEPVLARLVALQGTLSTQARALVEQLTRTKPVNVDGAWISSVRANLPAARTTEIEPPPSEPVARRNWELLHAVYMDPKDDSLRLVCGDSFAEVGDPRGEFIALGFKAAAGGATPTDLRRMATLVKEHGNKWIGRLATKLSLDDVAFEKGFLARVCIDPKMMLSAWKEISPAPELGTIHTIHLHAAGIDWFNAIATTPALAHLRELKLLSDYGSSLEEYSRNGAVPVFANELISFHYASPQIPSEGITALRARFPNLTKLSLSWINSRWGRDRCLITEERGIRELATVLNGLVDLTLTSQSRLAGFAVSVLTHLPLFPKSIERIGLQAGPEHWTLRRSPHDSTRFVAEITAGDATYEAVRVRAVLAALPDDGSLIREGIVIPEKKSRK